ncbi:WD40/YVTN repeat-like-containing domain [Pycnococcus provasolii]
MMMMMMMMSPVNTSAVKMMMAAGLLALPRLLLGLLLLITTTTTMTAFMMLDGGQVVVVSAHQIARKVPPLACFGDAPVARMQIDVVRSDFSSLAATSSGSTLFALNNGEKAAFQFTISSENGKIEKIAEWNLTNIVADPEGIAYLGVNKAGHEFAITDENPSKVHMVTLQHGGGGITSSSVMTTAIDPPAMANLGFEGVANVPGEGLFVVQEQKPAALWFVAASRGVVTTPQKLVDTANTLGIDALSDITAAGGDAAEPAEVFVLSKAPKQITRLDISDRNNVKIIEQYAGAICGMKQPEAIAFTTASEDGKKVRMLVGGEPTELLIFEADVDCDKKLNSTEGAVFSCPDLAATVGCDMTIEEGGCPQRRCDKALSNSEKVCTDDSPDTQCSLEECKQKCTNHAAFKCSTYAYDEAEKECYVFESCVGETDEPDYTLYVMRKGCDMTIEEGGCPQRRCDKALSNSEKVCTDDSPDTQCSLEECKQKCTNHAAFKCSTYAYDEAEKECYVFESCVGETDEPDYTLYVMTNRECKKDMSEGGCPQRMCSLEMNDSKLVCDGDAARVNGDAATPCTLDECKKKCDNDKTCTHFMHDADDNDCYLMSGCKGEGFSDDFTVYCM